MADVRVILRLALSLLLLTIACSAADNYWPPITPEEQKLKDNPSQPGSEAMILYHEFVRNDTADTEFEHMRIKIFTDSGRRFADVEIPYLKDLGSISHLEARTIFPDGRTVMFQGPFYDKALAKARDYRYLAKTFTFPNITPGCIIEYRYETKINVAWHFRYIVGHSLGIKHEIFRIVPSWGDYRFFWTAIGLPPMQQRPGSWLLDTTDVPPYPEEDALPPEAEIKPHINAYYANRDPEQKDAFWKREGKEWRDFDEKFIGNSGFLKKTAESLVSPGDAPEAKLRKLYAKVQQLRNFTYERPKSQKEWDKEKIKKRESAEDVWKDEYGSRFEINRLFIALARGLGFEADVVMLSSRDSNFFHDELLDPYQLNNEIAVVVLDGKETYLDPGTPACPFGMLAWDNTGVMGMRIRRGDTPWVITPMPRAVETVVTRETHLQWQDGTLAGTMTLRHTGYSAISERQREKRYQEAEIKKLLEDEMKESLAAGSSVELTATRGQLDVEKPLEFDFKISVPNIGSETGSRLLLPLAIFQSQRLHPFRHEQRKFPLYYKYPYEERDAVHLQMPQGYGVESLPAERRESSEFGIYNQRTRKSADEILLERRLSVDGFYFPVEQYPVLKSFFDKVRASDEDSVMFQVAGKHAQ